MFTARRFTREGDKYQRMGRSLGRMLNGASKISFHCWCCPHSVDNQVSNGNRIWSGFVTTTAPAHFIGINGQPDPPSLYTTSRSVSTDSTNTTQLTGLPVTLDAWHSVGVVFDYPIDQIRGYVDLATQNNPVGITWGNTTFTYSGSQTNEDAVGCELTTGNVPRDLFGDESYIYSFDGLIGCLSWWPYDIGSDAYWRLATGEHPLAVAPRGIIHFPMGQRPNEIERLARIAGTVVGDLPVVPGPPMLRPPHQQPALRGRRLTTFDPASGDGAIPVVPPMLLGSHKVA